MFYWLSYPAATVSVAKSDSGTSFLGRLRHMFKLFHADRCNNGATLSHKLKNSTAESELEPGTPEYGSHALLSKLSGHYCHIFLSRPIKASWETHIRILYCKQTQSFQPHWPPNTTVYEEQQPQQGSIPVTAGTQHQNDVVSTSMRSDHVASTLIRRHFNIVCPLGYFGLPFQ